MTRRISSKIANVASFLVRAVLEADARGKKTFKDNIEYEMFLFFWLIFRNVLNWKMSKLLIRFYLASFDNRPLRFDVWTRHFSSVVNTRFRPSVAQFLFAHF